MKIDGSSVTGQSCAATPEATPSPGGICEIDFKKCGDWFH